MRGIENFRDVGGYATRCGRGLRHNRLYRSAHHHHAADEDLSRLQNLAPTAIVDLREFAERQIAPSRRWPDFQAVVIENDIPLERTPWQVRLNGEPLTYDWVLADGFDFYRTAPFARRHVDLFARGLAALAELDGGVVVHCASGKDRTGLFCAIALYLAGVHLDDVMDDFLKSNDESRLAERMAAHRPSVEAAARRAVGDEAMALCVSVHPAWLDSALAEIAARHGSVEAYAQQVLDVDGARRERLHDRLLGTA